MTAATFTEREVRVAGLQVHLTEAGEGPPLVVLHHSTGPSWTPFAERVSENAQVIAPDLPGYGQSERPTWARTIRDQAILCHQILDAAGLATVHLLGLGCGGWIAAEMASMGQRRLATLILVGAAGLRPSEGRIAEQVIMGYEDYVRLGFTDDAAFERCFGPEPAKELVDLWDRSREMTVRVNWKPWMYDRRLPYLLEQVTIPALVVWGDADRVVPLECGQQYARLLPRGRLEIIENAGHNVDLEQPDVLAEVVSSFVAEND